MSTVVPGLDVEVLKHEIKETYAAVSQEHGNLVATYMRSMSEDTRRKALEYGANGATVKAFKPA